MSALAACSKEHFLKSTISVLPALRVTESKLKNKAGQLKAGVEAATPPASPPKPGIKKLLLGTQDLCLNFFLLLTPQRFTLWLTTK